jgi:hypothetical protein
MSLGINRDHGFAKMEFSRLWNGYNVGCVLSSASDYGVLSETDLELFYVIRKM